MDQLRDPVHVAAGVLHAHDIRMHHQFSNHLDRQVVCRATRHAIEKHRQRRTVGDRLVVSQHLAIPHLLPVVVRRAHQDRIVIERCCIICQAQGLKYAFPADSGEQYLIWRRRRLGHPQRLSRLVLAQHDSLAR